MCQCLYTSSNITRNNRWQFRHLESEEYWNIRPSACPVNTINVAKKIALKQETALCRVL